MLALILAAAAAAAAAPAVQALTSQVHACTTCTADCTMQKHTLSDTIHNNQQCFQEIHLSSCLSRWPARLGASAGVWPVCWAELNVPQSPSRLRSRRASVTLNEAVSSHGLQQSASTLWASTPKIAPASALPPRPHTAIQHLPIIPQLTCIPSCQSLALPSLLKQLKETHTTTESMPPLCTVFSTDSSRIAKFLSKFLPSVGFPFLTQALPHYCLFGRGVKAYN